MSRGGGSFGDIQITPGGLGGWTIYPPDWQGDRPPVSVARGRAGIAPLATHLAARAGLQATPQVGIQALDPNFFYAAGGLAGVATVAMLVSQNPQFEVAEIILGLVTAGLLFAGLVTPATGIAAAPQAVTHNLSMIPGVPLTEATLMQGGTVIAMSQGGQPVVYAPQSPPAGQPQGAWF